MDSFTQWAIAVWADFKDLGPTDQIASAIGVIGFLGGCIFGVRQFFAPTKPTVASLDQAAVPPPQISVALAPSTEGPSDLNAMLELIKSGTITPEQGMELARSIQRQAGTDADADGYADQRSGDAQEIGVGSRVEAMTGGDEERRAFANVVVELATSADEMDRDIILAYARGDRATALAALVRQAEDAGPDGAQAWRDVASLARPFDQKQSIAALRKASDLDPSDVVSLCRLSRALSLTDDLHGAKAAAGLALERATSDTDKARSLIRLASATLGLGDTLRGKELARGAVEHARKAAAADGEDLARARVLANAFEIQSSAQSSLGWLVDARQSVDRAILLHDHLMDEDPEDEDTIFEWLRARSAATYLVKQAGDLQEAADAHRSLMLDAKEAAVAHPQNLWLAASAVSNALQRAFLLDDLGEETKALALAKQVKEDAERLIKRDPAYADVRSSLIWSQVLIARVLARQNQIEQALKVSEDMVLQAREFAQTGTIKARKHLSVALMEDADLRRSIGDLLGAKESMIGADHIVTQLAADHPDDMERLDDALIMKWKLGVLAKAEDDPDAYLRLSREALETAEALDKAYPGHRRLKKHLAYGHQRVSVALQTATNEDLDGKEQLAHSKEAWEQLQALVKANPSDAQSQAWAVEAQRILAANLSIAGDHEAGLEMGKKALAESQRLEVDFPQTQRFGNLVTSCLGVLASAALGNSDLDEAIDYCEQFVEHRRANFDQAPRIRANRENLQHALSALSANYSAARRDAEALEAIDEALKLADRGSNVPNRQDDRMELVLLDQKKRCLSTMGRTQDSETIRAEVLARSETAALQETDLVARSNLAIAYVNEAWAAARTFDWDKCADWTSKAEALHEGLEKHPAARRKSRYQVILLRTEMASAKGDDDAIAQNLRVLIDMAEEDAARQPTLTNRLAVLDLKLRLVATEDSFVKRSDRLDDITQELIAIGDENAGNQLASGSIADVWTRIARLRLFFSDYADVAPAVSKGIAFGEAALSGQNTSTLGLFCELRLYRSRAALNRDAITVALGDIAAVEAALPDVKAASDDAHAYLWLKAETLEQRRDIANLKGDFDQADSYAEQQLAVIEDLLVLRPKSTSLMSDHLVALSGRVENAIERGLPDHVDSSFKQAKLAAECLRGATEKAVTLTAVERHERWLTIEIALFNGAGATCCEDAEALVAQAAEAFECEGSSSSAVAHYQMLGQLGRVHKAAGNIAGAADAFAATLIAIDNVQSLSPDWAANDRNKLRVLYDLASVTGKEPDFAAVASQISAMRVKKRLLGTKPWVAELLSDPRVVERMG